MDGASRAIEQAVLSWNGVASHPYRFGGVKFRLGKVELGLYGDRLADLTFPTTVRNSLVQEGRAQPHHSLPSSGWVSCFVRDSNEVDKVIELRLIHDRVTARRKSTSERPSP
jgi:hypothetical protein